MSCWCQPRLRRNSEQTNQLRHLQGLPYLTLSYKPDGSLGTAVGKAD